jgi:hypothetical protein
MSGEINHYNFYKKFRLNKHPEFTGININPTN